MLTSQATHTPATAIRVSPRDDVAVALRQLEAGETVRIDSVAVLIKEHIPAHHKVALHDIADCDAVRRFGHPIGRATEAIAAGCHVHTHNLRTRLDATKAYTYAPATTERFDTASLPARFLGYRRPDGQVGTRNEIWIVPTVGCVAKACEKIAHSAGDRQLPGIESVLALPHVFGCSQLGDDLASTRNILSSLIAHPNAAGVVLVGLGCESNQSADLVSSLPPLVRDKVRTVVAQTVPDEIECGLQAIQELANLAGSVRRETCPVSDLVIGLKCGGSDALSGLTANPLLGDATDQLTEAGGRTILTEIPEIFGAEHLLMARARNEAVFEQTAMLVNDFKQYFIDHNQPVYENPSPGNKAGGITTLEEKSLGAVQKAGRSIVTDVIRYGERVSQPGLTLLEAPGNDAVSSTALAAAGATLILFTTGRGTPLGFPVPTVKVSSNSELAARKPNWIDFDAGPILSASNRADIAADFMERLIAIASGAPTRNELNQERSIAIWKRGVTL